VDGIEAGLKGCPALGGSHDIGKVIAEGDFEWPAFKGRLLYLYLAWISP